MRAPHAVPSGPQSKQDTLATLGAGLFTNGVWDMLSVIVPLYGVAVGLNAAEIGLIVAAPIGPVNLICIRRTLAFGPLNGFFAGLGAAFGALIFGLVQMGIFYTGIDTDWFKVFLGIVILVAVLVNNYTRAKALGERQGS